MKLKYYSVLSLCVLGGLLTTPASVWAAQQTEITISSAGVLNPSAVEVVFSNQQRMTLDFYGENIFRMFQEIREALCATRRLLLKLRFW